ncbi:hypothetical protein LXL04_015163 [Taraxacum kok-saghyz]
MDKFRKSFNKSPQNEPQIEPEEKQILLHGNEYAVDRLPSAAAVTTMPSSPPLPDSGERRRDTGKGANGNVDRSKEAELATYKLNSAPDQQNPNTVWRESSYDFSKDGDKFDFFTSNTPSPQQSPALSRIAESPNHYGMLTPKEVRVSFHDEVIEPQPLRQRSNGSGSGRGGGEGGAGGGGEEVVICSANASFKRRSSLMRTKTKSRLMDPPETDQKSGRLYKSGILGKGGSEIDEDDPFTDDDLPDEYKQLRYSKWTLLQIFSLILILGALICSLTIPYLKKKDIYDLVLWKWGVMILVLICGRLVSGWGIRILVILIERNFLLRKRVLYFVYGLRKAVQNCVWLGLVLIAWECIFDKKVARMTDGKVLHYVTKIWVCLLVGTVVWLFKTVVVKTLASSFHVSTFFDRIQESLFNQYVIETLSGPPVIEIQHEREEEDRVISEVQKLQNAGATLPPDLKANIFKKSGRFIGTPRTPMTAKSGKFSETITPKKVDEGITIDHLHRLNQKNISAWNMKRLMNIVRTGVLSTLDEQLEGTTGDEDDSAVQITNEKQAKVAAKKIFCNVAKPGSKRIYLADLMRFLRDDEALKAIRLFDSESETKGISKGLLKNWVVNVFRERRALALSLNDTKTAVNKLHHMLNVGVGLIIIVIWLLILKVATTHFFIFLSSQMLLVVFVFGNTCKTTFEAIIFLFVMHPFDVGDRCEVDSVQMIVEEMNILTTVFLRFDNQKIIYPNSVLATKPIANYYRSPDMGDAVEFCVHVSTPSEKIALMKERILTYIENKSDHWYPAPIICLRDIEDMNRLKISIWPSHRMNFQDMGERWQRRALLVEEMIKVFRDLDIEYRMLPVDVNVRNMPNVASNRLPSTWTSCAN